MITMKNFIAENNPILRQEAKTVSFPLSQEEKDLIKEMREFLINSQNEDLADKYDLRPGVGLAAPQIGVAKQICVVYLTEEDEETGQETVLLDQVIINPKIKSHAVQQVAIKEGEGCLSVPRDVPGLVPRPKRVKFEYSDMEGNRHVMKLKDFEAIVVQHELDHLKGIMFYDHINPQNPWLAQGIELI